MNATKIQPVRFLFGLALVCFASQFVAADNSKPALADTGTESAWADVQKAAAPIRARLLKHLPKQFPGIKAKTMIAFYRKNLPDMLLELDEKCLADDQDAAKYLRSMVRHYRNLETLRKRNKDEYKRVLEIERMEERTRALARQVRHLRSKEQVKASVATEKQTKRHQLHEALAKVFDAAQQNQLIEINRLEAEVRECRKLLKQREANRKIIIDSRYFELTGRDWVDNTGSRASFSKNAN